MAGKNDWRPGPAVCRCCLTEGCYKDISTEYFWMGKREVYAEMLSETFSLSIAYSQSGPNSNSRLICEPCISRLRDASDFRRQVQECEKTFMQYLDPSSSVSEVEVPMESLEAQVKVERVKVEKAASDDEFDDRGDFHDDDDDDDMDDQPLTKLASKVPKKESVDILDLLDNAKTAEKRKSSTKAKTPAAKKSKTKKDVKATSSKAPKPEKKKKVDREELRTRIVQLYQDGVGIHEISRGLDVSRNTVRLWIRRFRSEGSLRDRREDNRYRRGQRDEEAELDKLYANVLGGG